MSRCGGRLVRSAALFFTAAISAAMADAAADHDLPEMNHPESSLSPMAHRAASPDNAQRRVPAGVANLAVIALALAALHVAPSAWARDAKAGRIKAQSCAVCHGPAGISTAPDAPNLAGQPALYVERQLKAYRSGERKHEVMAVIAKPLTDDDIANLAAWYNAIRVDAEAPE